MPDQSFCRELLALAAPSLHFRAPQICLAGQAAASGLGHWINGVAHGLPATVA